MGDSVELSIGNAPAGTTEILLVYFCNAAMRRAGLCPPDASPVTEAKLNHKLGTLRFETPALAKAGLNLDGIPFLGATLQFSRPVDYSGPPDTDVSSWLKITGQETHTPLDPEQEKLSRELFVGNTPPEVTPSELQHFLGQALQQVGLTLYPGNPIHTCRVNGKFAFCEFRTAQEATMALQLHQIPMQGVPLRVGRPSKWTGPPDPPTTWEDVLAKYVVQRAVTTSAVVELQHMLTAQDLEDPDEYQDILEDTREECGQFGTLKSVVIPRKGEPGATKVFLEYETVEEAGKALEGLQGRTFDGRLVEAAYFDMDRFRKKDYA